MRSPFLFYLGQKVRVIETREVVRIVELATSHALFDDDDDLSIYRARNPRTTQTHWYDEDELEYLPDDPPSANDNYIVLPKHLVRRTMTPNEAEQPTKDLTVPAFIARIVSEHRAAI